jgi:long-chain acyl-CoA synthetase
MKAVWLQQYPEDVPARIRTDRYCSVVEMLDESFSKHREQAAFRFMEKSFSFGTTERLSAAFAAFLQRRGLRRGDRVAVMLPNIPQYPVVVAGILRAGMVVVNVNPLYTVREARYQIEDSGAAMLVALEDRAGPLREALPLLQTVITSVRDLIVDPVGTNDAASLAAQLPEVVRFMHAIEQGSHITYEDPELGPDDIAVLQYTGGTTGVSKGAVLLHRNIVANILQCEAWYSPAVAGVAATEQVMAVCALPLYHIFGFTGNMLLGLRMGWCNILIVNPRDISAMLATLAKERFHILPAVNTLFNELPLHPDFDTVDWSHLRICVGGGMAVQSTTAQRWFARTGRAICEGYGMSEASPVVTCNPVVGNYTFNGSIGLPLPGTDVVLIDDAGQELGPGHAGELAIRGPQIMCGYWGRPDETVKVMTDDGLLLTGDIAVMDEHGYFRIVDRKKDVIVVSGFNVYPNEIEEVVTKMPGVVECAAVGMPDEKSGEAVKVVIVKGNSDIVECDVRRWCESNLTAYKRPKLVEFRTELPKSAVGKVVRRHLREL